MRYTINLSEGRIDTKDETFMYEILNSKKFLDNMIYYIMFNDIDNNSGSVKLADSENIMFYNVSNIEILNTDKSKEARLNMISLLDETMKDFHNMFDASSLDRLRCRTKSRLSNLCHQYDGELVNNNMYIISSLGFKLNADLRSQNNLQRLIETYENEVYYKDYNNELHRLTLEDLKTILNECIENGRNLYKQKWQYSSLIDTLNEKELKSLTLTFTMMDFSKNN